jgi:hypothetical protein
MARDQRCWSGLIFVPSVDPSVFGRLVPARPKPAGSAWLFHVEQFGRLEVGQKGPSHEP